MAANEIVASVVVLDNDDDHLDDVREAGLGTDIYNADTDGNGQSDAMEVAFGTSPTNVSSRVTVTSEVAPSQPGMFRITWPSVQGKVYQVEKWQENASPPSWTTIAERTAAGSLTEFLYPMTDSRVMLRVKTALN